ncbi:hypothetical protein GOBAR_AA06882 [Gossypium barbadense]|uniref:Thioesterase domain-containing protein n=1 Tax=Gossypium barbadense TaxID=3634 RepID=A0A2P5YDK1_GOSBA|nr:hypothetical protein GOBAR_AA06882 [Gossypium barbadense]
MDLETVKKYLEKGVGADGDDKNASTINGMPSRFFENFIMQGLHVDQIEKGRVLCSMKVPPRLLEEIEIEAKALRVGKTVAVVTVEFRKKKTGKIIAQGRHTKYLTAQSKM